MEISAFRWFERQSGTFRYVLLTLLGLGLACASVVVFFAYEFSDRQMCGSHGFQAFNSPEGKLRAVLYDYDCGATTDFSTRLAVVKQSSKFDPFDVSERELVMIADSNHGAAGVDSNGILPIAVEWTDSQHLSVRLPEGARTFVHKQNAGSVVIHYENDAQ
ncbi:hypothetical protein SAMN05421770_102322 [Granulicella rosea]|uniref:Uncharacterized protein n=1 Tax=Granulicella rosea TaxID=474952 RepID=A0A239HED3_9BACT|nr:hypothetical protein SAMN05421770_102322 [Granulicella rosea]